MGSSTIWSPGPGLRRKQAEGPYFSGGMNAVHRQPYYASRRYNTIMLKTYRYRLYPSKSQVTLLEQTLEICRWVYNDTLALRKNAWEQ
ncbi:MAG: helix-turn-helix domain-containing protein, partial [Candidatus Methanoculleus thermohydrogenotrophicum]